jgi:hypothetical protein
LTSKPQPADWLESEHRAPDVTLFGPKAMLDRIRAAEDPAAVAASSAADEAKWRLTRAPYLLY